MERGLGRVVFRFGVRGEVRGGVAQVPGAGVLEMLNAFAAEGLGRAKLVGGELDLGEVFEGLHLLEGVEERFSEADGAVVGHEDGFVVGDVGSEAGGGLRRCRWWRSGARGTGPRVMMASWQRRSSRARPEQAKAVAMGGWAWMTAATSRAHLVDGEVHADLAGDVAGAGEEASAEIGDDDVLGFEEALADAGGGDEEAFVVEARGEVAAGSGGVAEPMNPLAEANDLPSQLGFRANWMSHGCYSFVVLASGWVDGWLRIWKWDRP